MLTNQQHSLGLLAALPWPGDVLCCLLLALLVVYLLVKFFAGIETLDVDGPFYDD